MPEGLLAARLLLAAVFGVSGGAKLVDQTGTRAALRQFGVPGWLVGSLALGLPVIEASVAIGLVSTASARWAAVAALALLAVFIAGIGVNLARGKHPDCHCFGQLHSAPIGLPTLVRNGVLASAAGLVAWQGPGSDPGNWLDSPMPLGWMVAAVGVVLAGVILLEGWFLLNLTSQQGRLLLRLEALEASNSTRAMPAGAAAGEPQSRPPTGRRAPDFELPGLLGETLTLRALLASGRPLLLVFSDAGCGPCNALMPELGRWQREQANRLNIAIISRGSSDSNRAKAREHGLSQVLLQKDDEMASAYEYGGTPSAVLVGVDGQIASRVAAGADAIRVLVRRTMDMPTTQRTLLPIELLPNGRSGAHAQRQAGSAAPRIGQPAPAFSLPDLDNRTVELTGFKGRSTLVLFWNPGCGFCQKMLNDLRAWEDKPHPGDPGLLVVSTGSLEAIRAMQFRSPVLLDPDGGAMRAFGANGTPTAVLVDAEGRIGSRVAVGTSEVMALARTQSESVGAGTPDSHNGSRGPL